MKRPATTPLAPSSTGKDTSLLSKALRELSGASNLKDERMGHYLATWALSCPLARRQFNNAVQHVHSATSTQTTGEACKAAVEAYTASLLPPTAMCELVLNMGAPKSSWRTLSELYTLRKLGYHRTVPSGPYSRPICTERAFQARCKELVAPVQLDNPVSTVLPKGSRASPSPRPSRRPRARAKPPRPPQTPSPHLARKGPGPLWECAGCGGHPVCPLGGGGQWGDRQPSDGVGGWG